MAKRNKPVDAVGPKQSSGVGKIDHLPDIKDVGHDIERCPACALPKKPTPMASESVEQVVHRILAEFGMRKLGVLCRLGQACYLAGQQAERERCAGIATSMGRACDELAGCQPDAEAIAAAIRRGE